MPRPETGSCERINPNSAIRNPQSMNPQSEFRNPQLKTANRGGSMNIGITKFGRRNFIRDAGLVSLLAQAGSPRILKASPVGGANNIYTRLGVRPLINAA